MITVGAVGVSMISLAIGAPIVPDCTSRSLVASFSPEGDFCAGDTARISLDLQPEDEVFAHLEFDSEDDIFGMSVQWRVLDQKGNTLFSDSRNVYGVFQDSLLGRGGAGDCGHPVSLEIINTNNCGTWKTDIESYAREGWNEAATLGGEAQGVGVRSDWCGNINAIDGCANNPVWRVDLDTGDTLMVAAELEGDPILGTSINLDLLNDDGSLKERLLTSTIFGKEPFEYTLIHEGEPARQYLLLDRRAWDLWRYSLGFEVRRTGPPIVLELNGGPEPVQGRPGQTLNMTANLTNRRPDRRGVRVRTDVVLPNQSKIGAILGPQRVSIAGGQTRVLPITQPIPLIAAPGDYLYIGVADDTRGNTLSADTISVQISVEGPVVVQQQYD